MDNMEDYLDDSDEASRPVGRPPGGRGRKRRLSGEQKPMGESVHYHCDYCQKDISDVVRIRCAVCKDFDLCLHCFSVGVEIRGHKNDHAYRIIDYTSFPLFEEKWGADEELLLLEGIQMHGMGNWTEVADHVATKSPDACRDHYLKVYINSPTCPLPDTSRLLTTSLEEYHKKRQEKLQREMLEGTHGDGEKGTGSKTVSKNLNKKQKIKTHNVSCPVASTEYAGYMPKRYEFETEWDNDAEFLIADLVFHESDDEALTELKFQVLDIYNRRLKERVERRKFVIDNNLMEFYKKKKPKSDKGKNKEQDEEEKNLRKSMQKFMQAHNREQHEQLIEGLLAELALTRRILQLQEWRKNGIQNLAEGEVFENEKKRREAMLKRSGSSTNLSVPELGSVRGVRWLNRKRGSNWALPVPERDPKTIRRQAPLDLTGAPGLDQLSNAEKELCSTLRLFPQQYMIIKEVLIRESLSLGQAPLPKGHVKKLVKLETSKATKIHEFLERQGWINKKQA